MYSIIKPVLFSMDAERSHDVVMGGLQKASQSKFALSVLKQLYADKVRARPIELMGLKLKHPVGLAAGLDKQGGAGDALNALGFAWVEYGTVTPLPQAGNAKPRLFRLRQHDAIINRMGFNSIGLEQFIQNISAMDKVSIKGLNIGKNAATPIELANQDYILGMKAVYPLADYICVNISSPNTKNLRALQSDESLDSLLEALLNTRKELEDQHGFNRPIVLKVAPDLDSQQIDHLANSLIKYKIDGLAATNTTITRPTVDSHPLGAETGGLSGAPLASLSTQCIHEFRQRLQGEVAIIGSGGIFSAADAQEKLQSGADALQIYTSFIYKGPRLIREIVERL